MHYIGLHAGAAARRGARQEQGPARGRDRKSKGEGQGDAHCRESEETAIEWWRGAAREKNLSVEAHAKDWAEVEAGERSAGTSWGGGRSKRIGGRGAQEQDIS